MAGEDGRFEPVETQAPVIRVMSRSDLSGEPAGPDSDGIHHPSAVTGDALAALADRLVEEAGRLVGHGEILSLANDPQRPLVSDCHSALLAAADWWPAPAIRHDHLLDMGGAPVYYPV